MEIITYIFPFFVALILLLLFNKKMVWWEYLVLIAGSLFFSVIIASLMRHGNCQDTEYLGGYMTKITHYDDWDEWIHRTCTREVPLGEPQMVFRDMHRSYYTKDGDAQDYFWDGTIPHLRSLAWSHTYTNKVIGSSSVMKFKKITPHEAKKMGLYDYPQIEKQDQRPIIGLMVDDNTMKQVKYVNSFYGRRKQFRVFILVWTDKTIGISEEQRSYWQGGNKNEFVVCLGYDRFKDSIKWANAFSWSDDPKLEIATKRYFREHPKMDLKSYAIWLENHIGMWHRKEFKDFDYLSIPLREGQQTGLFVLTLIICVVLSVTLIGNEFENTNIYSTSVDVHRFWDYLLSQEPLLRKIEKRYRDVELWK